MTAAAQSRGRVTWLIRVPPGRENEDDARDGLLAADLGIRGDISHLTDFDDAIRLVESDAPGMRLGSIESRARSLHDLAAGIQPGDLILAPLGRSREVAIGLARPEMTVSSSGLPARRAEILRILPRQALPADLANSLAAQSGVARVRLPGAEARIAELLSGKAVAPEEERDPGSLLGGHDMAALVAAILESDGYLCHLSPPGPDGGVDIVAGRGILGFDGGVVVQVKSGRITCGTEEIDRLMGVMAAQGAGQGLLVSWGGFTRPALVRAASLRLKVRLWGREDVSALAGRAAPLLEGHVAEVARALARSASAREMETA